MLSNAYFLAKFRFDTAENEPAKNLQNLLISPILLPLTPKKQPRYDMQKSRSTPWRDWPKASGRHSGRPGISTPKNRSRAAYSALPRSVQPLSPAAAVSAIKLTNATNYVCSKSKLERIFLKFYFVSNFF